MDAAHGITLAGGAAGKYGRQPWWIAVPVRAAGICGLPMSVGVGVFALVAGLAAIGDNWRVAAGGLGLAAACLFWTCVFWDMVRMRRWAVIAACAGVWISILGALGAYLGEGSHRTADTVFTALGLQFPPNIVMLIGLALSYSPPPRMTFALGSFFIGPAELLPALFLTFVAISWRREAYWRARGDAGGAGER